MTAMTATPAAGAAQVLADDGRIAVFDDPYPHLIAGKVFSAEDAAGLLGWLEGCTIWQRTRQWFYDQHEFCLAPPMLPEMPPPARRALAPDRLRALRDAMCRLLGDPLQDRVIITCHRLDPGQGIAEHDDLRLGVETHRLTVTFRRDPFTDADGGHFVFLHSLRPLDIHRFVRPLHNAAVGFKLGGAPHGVLAVRGGTRFSMVFSFCAVRAVGEPDPPQPDAVAAGLFLSF